MALIWFFCCVLMAGPLPGFTATPPTSISDVQLKQELEVLWNSDSSGVWDHVAINLQGRTTFESIDDKASKPMFSRADREALLRHPTIKALTALFDNYARNASENEVVTPAEETEVNDFLNAILGTAIMKETHRFLAEKGLAARALSDFKVQLRDMWFGMYGRGDAGSRAIGSSGFEHVFLGEVKNGEVSGFHNWVYFLFQEKTGSIDYLGWSKKIDLSGASIVKNKFKWNGLVKTLGSMFVGTSPEYELALYTICFLARPELPCSVTAGGTPFSVVTHKFTVRGKTYIGSAYPRI